MLLLIHAPSSYSGFRSAALGTQRALALFADVASVPYAATGTKMTPQTMGLAASAHAAIHFGVPDLAVRHPLFDPDEAGHGFSWKRIGCVPYELDAVPEYWIPLLMHLFDVVVAPSSFCHDAFKATYPPLRVATIPYPVQSEFYPPSDPLQGKRVGRHILTVVEPRPHKGLDDTVKAMVFGAVDHGERCHLIVKRSGGQGCEEAAELQRYMTSIIEATGAQYRVSAQVLFEPIQDTAIADMFRQADLYVSLHRGGGYEMGVAQAVATGIPVVTTRYGGPLDFVGHSRMHLVPVEEMAPASDAVRSHAGRMWAVPHAAEAVAAITNVLDNIEHETMEARQAVASFERRFGPAAIATQWLDLLGESQR